MDEFFLMYFLELFLSFLRRHPLSPLRSVLVFLSLLLHLLFLDLFHLILLIFLMIWINILADEFADKNTHMGFVIRTNSSHLLKVALEFEIAKLEIPQEEREKEDNWGKKVGH